MTVKEWKLQPSGTKAIRVKCYDEEGRCRGRDYILKNDPSYKEKLNDARQIPLDWFMETVHVIRK